ncbi:MAG: molybdopterin-converting factor chain 2 [Candidatus Melainabacteria bacterium HGW-Melainabacteria-1]|nr:MAG: molybdopterin-converting factor chain 2 [Candidatus Melainabacteria bacterium HGW-Melainabacteria-1]
MFRISSDAIDPAAELGKLNDPRAGARVSFEGLVRNHNQGRAVNSLEYECFEALAQHEAEAILQEARHRFEVCDLACIHRVGHLQIGEIAVFAAATAAHRDEAFAACRYLIDQIKLRLPIWKKEHYADGDSQWVNCQACHALQTL